MSIQIEIAQSYEDEAALIEWLRARGEFLFHPRIFSAGEFSPKEFFGGMGYDLQVFRAQDEAVVRQHVSAVRGREATEQLGSFNGLTIEWGRTQWPAPGTCVPGRFYLDDRTPASVAISGELAKVMRQLVTMIRHSYPSKSDERDPYYVGPDLSLKIEKREAHLVYHGGKGAEEVKVVRNV